MKYLHGETPPWFNKVMAAVTTVPFFKSPEQLDHIIRPVGFKNEISHFLQRIVASQNRSTVNDVLHPTQLGCDKAGAFKLIHCVRIVPDLVEWH